jgi:site-specific DNA-methyltransferase (adenine-specific)
MQPTLTFENATVYLGSCLDVLPTLADNSVDAIVTDPPYELGFMGKSWDNSGIAYNVDVWRECLRVLKPGGHILAFGASRTWHRLAVAIEDAGFEMRDSIAWLYGSGFPKSHNISIAIDKQSGAMGHRGKRFENSGLRRQGKDVPDPTGIEAHKPITSEAKAWDGWGTALKPAFEPIVVGRKPLVGTVAENVLEWGTGGLNIDATRIGTEQRINQPAGSLGNGLNMSGGLAQADRDSSEVIGRWPANIILDEHTAKLLDEQSGFSKSSGTINRWTDGAKPFGGGAGHNYESIQGVADSGGASRFFYVAKANKKDRNEGLDDLVAQESAGKGNGLGRLCAICGASILKPCECPDRTFVNPPKQNFHPTVKPTALMQYLVRLVTPEGGTVLDPFTGSGSTGKAAILEGKQFIGIELTEEYLPIIAGRLQHAINTSEEKEDDLFASL